MGLLKLKEERVKTLLGRFITSYLKSPDRLPELPHTCFTGGQKRGAAKKRTLLYVR